MKTFKQTYNPSAPRAVFAVAAIAMTAVTIVASIVVPATIDVNVSQLDSLAQPSRATAAPIVASNPIVKSGALDVS